MSEESKALHALAVEWRRANDRAEREAREEAARQKKASAFFKREASKVKDSDFDAKDCNLERIAEDVFVHMRFNVNAKRDLAQCAGFAFHAANEFVDCREARRRARKMGRARR